MSQTAKMMLAVIVTALVVGIGVYCWQTSYAKCWGNNSESVGMTSYTGDEFLALYPSNYQATKDAQGITTISGPSGKIMIGDFEPDAAPAPTRNMTQDQKDEFPKDIKYHGKDGKVASALFYKTGDDATKKVLETIQNSIEVE
ncbi:MAG: hypothetical protein AAB384_04110 [Patescibacteria group bacterium]